MKKSLQSSFLFILFIAAIVSVTGCNKKTGTILPLPAPIMNPIISGLTSTTVTVGARAGNANIVTENGFCYSATNKVPTTADIFIPDTIGARWQSKIVGLTPNTTYYIRAYAVNDTGTGYSDVFTVTTPATNAVPVGTVTTLVGSSTGASGYVEGTGSGALLDGPLYVTYNPTLSNLTVCEAFNNSIRSVSMAGATSTTIYSGIGYADGSLAQARFYGPRGISFDAQGNAYVADMGNNVIRKITTGGVVSTLAGNTIPGYVDGAGTKAEFYNPMATVVDAAGNVYVADRTNSMIRKITPAGVVTVLAGFKALNGYPQSTVPGYADGDGGSSLFNYPVALTIDATGNLYVADYKNSAIRKVTPAGVVSTVAGGLIFPALIGHPTGVVFDTKGNMFISDGDGRILEITTNKVLYVLAGATNAKGYVNDDGAKARFDTPQSITIDPQGNLYVADVNNNVIRKITVTVK
jgi:sugar lactone lactonase YvrE